MASPAAFQFGKLIVVLGVVLVAVGLLLMAGSGAAFSASANRPEISLTKTKNASVYFPVVTCLLLSALATLILWVISVFRRP